MAIKCEICDSTNLLKQDGVFVCQDCGARYTTEEIKKMVTGLAPAPATISVAPTPEPKKETPVQEAKPDKNQEIAQLLEWAEKAYAEGNKGAGDTYLGKAIGINSADRNVIEMCLKQGKTVSRGILKGMIEKTPANKQDAAYEYAYDILEKQGMSLGFPFAEDDYERLKGHGGTVQRLTEKTIPELKMEGFWDIDRLLTIHFKSAIRWMSEYQLPEPTMEEGLSAAAHWGIVAGIFNTDRYFQEADALIPPELKKELYQAFYNACNTVLNGTFYIQVHVSYQHFEYPKVTEDLMIKSYHAINASQPWEAKKWGEAKEVRAKYENLLKKMEADTAAAVAAERAKKNEAYWAAYPEEYNQLKSEKLLLEAKIRKAQNEHQADPKKKAAEQNRRDVVVYEHELRNCGVFQGKRKKELTERIEFLRKEERESTAAYEENTKAYERNLKELQDQLQEVNKKLDRE